MAPSLFSLSSTYRLDLERDGLAREGLLDVHLVWSERGEGKKRERGEPNHLAETERQSRSASAVFCSPRLQRAAAAASPSARRSRALEKDGP